MSRSTVVNYIYFIRMKRFSLTLIVFTHKSVPRRTRELNLSGRNATYD